MARFTKERIRSLVKFAAPPGLLRIIKQFLMPEVVKITNNGRKVVGNSERLLLGQLSRAILHHVVPEVEELVRGRFRELTACHGSFESRDERLSNCSLCDLGFR